MPRPGHAGAGADVRRAPARHGGDVGLPGDRDERRSSAIVRAIGHWPLSGRPATATSLAAHRAGDQPAGAAGAQRQGGEPGHHPDAVREPQRDQPGRRPDDHVAAATRTTASVTSPATAR